MSADQSGSGMRSSPMSETQIGGGAGLRALFVVGESSAPSWPRCEAPDLGLRR